MTEKERLEVVKTVKQDIAELRKIVKYEAEYAALLSDEKVKRFLQLQEEIEKYNLGNGQKFAKDVNRMIYYEFFNRFSGIKKEQCKHDIWIYVGSYAYNNSDPYLCKSNYNCLCGDENHKAFSYNEYECLECGMKIKIEDWEEFERTHFVLKDRNQLDVNCYRTRYYQLLYTNPVTISQQMIIDEFNKKRNEFSRKKTK